MFIVQSRYFIETTPIQVIGIPGGRKQTDMDALNMRVVDSYTRMPVGMVVYGIFEQVFLKMVPSYLKKRTVRPMKRINFMRFIFFLSKKALRLKENGDQDSTERLMQFGELTAKAYLGMND